MKFADTVKSVVSACPVASNCTIFPVATSVVCVFGFTGVLDEALVGWAVAWTGADGDGALDEAASADPAKDNVATATASERMVICMQDLLKGVNSCQAYDQRACRAGGVCVS